MNEREIDLLDMLLKILLRWRGMVVFMVIGAVFMGIFSYVKSDKAEKEARAAYEEQMAELEAARLEAMEEAAQEEKEVADAKKEIITLNQTMLEKRMTATQMMNVLTVIENEKLREEKQDYLDHSILMQMDTDDIPEEQILFAVLAEDPDTANRIARAYEGAVASGGLTAYLAKQFKLEESAVDELFSVGLSSNSLMSGANTFKMVIIHPDEATCRKMATAIIDYAGTQAEPIEEVFGEHTLTVIGQYYSSSTNVGIMNTRRSYLNDILALDAAIAKAKDAFSDEEVAYYNCLTDSRLEVVQKDETGETGEEAEEELTDVLQVVPAHVSLKYVFMGIILFACLYAGVVAVIYILDNKLKACDNLENIYGVSALGQIPGEKETQKKPLQFIDDWFIRLFNRNKRQFSAEEAVNLATVAIRITAEKTGVDKVSLIGCDMKGGADRICETIKSKLADTGITADILNNVIYDAEVMEKLSDSPAAVLVEQAGSTLYSEVEEELALLKRQNIPVLGAVIKC